MASVIHLARPYAKAVFELAEQEKSFTKWSKALEAMAMAVKEPLLKKLLDIPVIASSDLVACLKTLLKKYLTPEAENLLRLLAEKKRLHILPAIWQEFASQVATAEGLVKAEVVSALKLDKELLQKVTKALEAKLKKKVDLHAQVDPDLLGGALVKVGDMVFDASVRSQLQDLKRQLTV